MKICLTTHQFLPEQKAGVEIYVYRTAKALVLAGHDVLVFTTRKDLSRKDGSVIREDYGGVRTLRFIQNLFHKDFQASFSNPRAESCFIDKVLSDFRPDVLHVHHLMHHSMSYPALARNAGVAVLMTLHDYWLDCPRFGTLRGYDGEICHEVEHERCARCLSSFSWRNPPKLAIAARAIHWLRRLTGIDLSERLQRLYRKNKRQDRPHKQDDSIKVVGMLTERRKTAFETLVPNVQAFLCPSKFLLSWMRRFGLPDDRLHHHPYGIPRPLSPVRAARSGEDRGEGELRFAFLGSVLPHKGAHVLIEAFRLLKERGVRAKLAIHGDATSSPSYGEELRQKAGALGVDMSGSFTPIEIDTHLRNCDVLVVPSLWYENSPITIHDARVRGIPALVSDIGALPELAPDARLRFAAGNAESLADAMASLVVAGLDDLELAAFPPSLDEDLVSSLKLYEQFVR